MVYINVLFSKPVLALITTILPTLSLIRPFVFPPSVKLSLGYRFPPSAFLSKSTPYHGPEHRAGHCSIVVRSGKSFPFSHFNLVFAVYKIEASQGII